MQVNRLDMPKIGDGKHIAGVDIDDCVSLPYVSPQDDMIRMMGMAVIV